MKIYACFLRKLYTPKRFVTAIAICVTFLFFILFLLWSFRTEIVENPALGRVAYHFKFGKLETISLDKNKDGKTDARMKVKSYDNEVGSNDYDVIEYWESFKMDGRFNLHFWRDEINGNQILEWDSDGDGIFEYRVSGNEAVAQFTKNAHSLGTSSGNATPPIEPIARQSE